MQVVTVGVVGGSDLVKISEQLGKTGTIIYFSCPCVWAIIDSVEVNSS